MSSQHDFTQAPQVSVQRSRFNRDSSVKLSFNAGDVIPYYVDEVLPGDTFSVRTSKVVRLQTLITPMMDNLYLDFYWFYVPSRLTWIHWQELMGKIPPLPGRLRSSMRCLRSPPLPQIQRMRRIPAVGSRARSPIIWASLLVFLAYRSPLFRSGRMPLSWISGFEIKICRIR